jgi:RimJ/RimL family protein N-acetyltransferase
VLADEGPKSLAMRVASELGYRRLVLFERPVDTTPAPNPLGLELGWVGEDRLDELAQLRPDAVETARERLSTGDRCSATWLDGRLASARWVSTGEARIEYLGMTLPLADGEFYLYDTYTRPDLRGRGIAPDGQRLLFPRLAAEGYTSAACACLPENRPAWRSILKGGFEPAGKLGFVGVGPWRREFVRRRPQAARHSSRSTA